MKDNKNLSEQITRLVIEVEREQKKFSAAVTRTFVIFIILILVFLGYTSYLTFKMRELTTPETVAILLNERIKDALPAIGASMREQMEPGAREMVDGLFKASHALIPQATSTLIEQGDILIDEKFNELYSFYQSNLSEEVNTKVDNYLALLETTEKAAARKELAREMVNELMDKVRETTTQTNAMIDSLSKELDALQAKPVKSLTVEDFYKRKLILSWMNLLNKYEDEKIIEPIPSITELISDVSVKLPESMK